VTSQPLNGIRVIDLSSPVGTYCTKLLADLGADVVLVEPPDGDPYRRLGPYRTGASGPEASLAFAYYQTNKKSITLDLDLEDDRAVLAGLGRSADVVVISPGGAPLWGYQPEALTLDWASPDSIVCAVTPYGATGPHRDRPATHLTSFAQGGQMCRTGEPGSPPRAQPGNLHFHLAATHAALAIVAALGVRDDVGGQFIDISAQEIEVFHDLTYEAYHSEGLRPGGRNIGIGVPPTGMWQCRDGILDIAAHADRHWEAFLEMLDHPEELAEPALRDMALRHQIFDGLSALIRPLLADRSRHELLEKGQQAGLPVCILNTPSQFIADPQLEARDYWTDLGRPETGALRCPAAPIRTTPRLFESGPAPLLGEHSEDLRSEVRPELRIEPANPSRRTALEGVRVLSLGAFVAGNTTAQVLAALGADVVKLEARSHPEVLRNATYNNARELAVEPSGATNTPMYGSLSKGTRGVSIEMDTDGGQAAFRDLVASCDIVIENFGAAVMRKWGCTFDALVEIQPRLIMASLSGYGRTGPRAEYLAYASSIANFTGLSEIWWPSGTYTDYVTATHTALAVLAARAHLQKTGEAVYVDGAQIEAFAAMGAGAYLDPLVNGVPAAVRVNTGEGSLLTRVFACAGEDRWATVEAVTVEHWNAVCEVVGRPDLITDNETSALSDVDDLTAALDVWAAPLSPTTASRLLGTEGVPAAPVANNEEVYTNPQLHHRHYPQTWDNPDLGAMSTPRSPYHLSETPGHFERYGPRLGEHTREVLAEWAGLDDGAIDALVQQGAAFDAG
jgi:crotonobetainyl-CoA:carnitine CoA-transferase CaiB-like acyl-CoA transferase